jgi:hypothetical protein
MWRLDVLFYHFPWKMEMALYLNNIKFFISGQLSQTELISKYGYPYLYPIRVHATQTWHIHLCITGPTLDPDH